jgi:hypothetical protein
MSYTKTYISSMQSLLPSNPDDRFLGDEKKILKLYM